MQSKEKDLRDRTKHFALSIIRMFSMIPKTTEAKKIIQKFLDEKGGKG